ncbi:MAG: hypothetical protein ABI855_05380 [Bacteroidota bacterium]
MRKKINTEYPDAPLSETPIDQQPEPEKEIEQQLLREKIIYQVKEDLYCKPRYKNFFDNYEPETIHCFVEAYSKRKAFYVMHGQDMLQKEETNQLYFHHLAENFIWEIQQKKLFDLQCLWRAEKVHVDGVQVTKDFLYLEATIKKNSCIEPVSPDELQLYVDYLFSDDYSDKEHFMQWQDYDFIKNQSLMFGNSGIPAWYIFYDKQVHAKDMHDLADIRGEKEFFYLKLLSKKNAVRKLYDDVTGKFQEDAKPPLHFNYKTLEFFINTFEDKSIVNYFYAAEKKHPDINKNSELNEALQLLRDSDEEIPIHKHRNWKDAVMEAAKFYKTKKIAEALITVYDEYMMRIKTQLPFYDETDCARQQIVLRNADNYKKQILKARELNGEAADFNF